MTSKQSIGILPLVAEYVDDYKFLANWLEVSFQGWCLPAITEPHDWCGLWMQLGCLNNHEHKRLGKGNRIYLKQFQCSCYRATVFQTFCYLLSHCGIKNKVHTVTWMGNLSYSKLKVEKKPKITCCPVCGDDFVPIYYDGIPAVPPDRNYERLVDADGRWYPVKTMEYSEPKYDYAPTRDLNETLKGLLLAN